MTQRDRMETILQDPEAQVEICMNCKHFYRHYILTKRRYMPAHYGHCVFPRVKSKKTYDTCGHFERKT